MKKIIACLIVLVIAVFLGLFMHKDSGYILIAYQHWTLETSFWIGLAVLIVAFIAIYAFIRALHHTTNIGNKLKNWMAQKQQQKAIQLTNIGLCELAEGHWKKAEKYLVQAAEKNHNELINYLAAARAAQEQNKFQERDLYLKKAHKAIKGSTIAVGLTQAQLQIQSKQWEQALATLKHLNEETIRHKFILKLLHQVYIELKEWENLKELLPQLKKYKVLTENEFNTSEKKVYLALLDKSKYSVTALETIWKNMPKYLQQDSTLIKDYVSYLLAENKTCIALPLIEKALKQKWDIALIKLYSEKASNNLEAQIKTILSWEKSHPHEPELLFSLSRLYIHDQNWSQAKIYLESSLSLADASETFELLGFTEEQLGHKDAALVNYKKALNFR